MKNSLFHRCLVGLLTALSACSLMAQGSVILNTGWTFRQQRLCNWHPATVPGTVHTDLMAIGQLDDPFFGLNERAVQWVDKEDWLYDLHFTVSQAQQQRARRELTFYGLDTYADVYLNDSLILQSDNMFRTYRVDISGLTKTGDRANLLRVHLKSPIREDLPKWQQFPHQYHASSDQSENGGVLDRQLSPFNRKAGYHYGWDWGPRIVTLGIWRPVVFTSWDDCIIRDVFVEQQEVTRKRAVIRHHVSIEAERETVATISVTDSASQRCLARQQVTLHRGINEVVLPYTIRNPKLWWTNGLGEPNLYVLRTNVELKSGLHSSLSTLHSSLKVGLRSLRLHREPDDDGKGEAFYFTLNGEKVFMKGANYIPCDIFLPRVTDSVYRRTIADAVAVNMNMLRVWGGGIYEDDRFYELCDENGILVWQDFMFACAMYPSSGAFLENCRQEAIDNVRRLRNHPCIALWCGNNEVLDAWFNWGWKRRSERQGDEVAERLWQEYQALFLKTLPEVVSAYAPQTSYQSTSPYADERGTRDATRGDYHYWEVWHERKPISEYNRFRARFFSEYGMQSFPELASIRRFAPDPKDWDITSDVMMAHQRGGAHANTLIENYLQTDYGRPQGFDTLLYVGQLMQGDAMKTAVEAHRRDKGYCWGSLVWQINDCWPVASWSTRDYYGRWKAAHYMLRPAMADILVSPIVKEDSALHIYIVNDRLMPVSGTLAIDLWTSKLQVSGSRSQISSSKVKVAANSSTDVWQQPVTRLLSEVGVAADEAIVHVEFVPDGEKGTEYANNYFFVAPQNLKLQAPHLDILHAKSCSISNLKASALTFELSTNTFTRGIFLSLDGDPDHHFSDNYFDLLPGEQRNVTVTTSLSEVDLKHRLRVMTYSSEFIPPTGW